MLYVLDFEFYAFQLYKCIKEITSTNIYFKFLLAFLRANQKKWHHRYIIFKISIAFFHLIYRLHFYARIVKLIKHQNFLEN